ncbi:MAG: hypothetical protein ACYDBT_02770 [Desulfobulbaceae bacterium]
MIVLHAATVSIPGCRFKAKHHPHEKKRLKGFFRALPSASVPPFSPAGTMQHHPQRIEIAACRVDIGSCRLLMARTIPYPVDKGRARRLIQKKQKTLGGKK